MPDPVSVSGPDIETLLRDAMAAHFIMYRALEQPGKPPGEWFCDGCGAKFGFSDSAIDHTAAHVAVVLRAHIVTAQADAWDDGLETGVALVEKGFASPNPYRFGRVALVGQIGTDHD